MSGGTEAVPGIIRAREMGLHVVVSDGSAEAPGLALADDVLIQSTYDVDGTVRAARSYHETVRPIDGVICIASDVPLTVAAVAADLGLVGVAPESARLSMDKLAMKDRFAADDIPIPWYAAVGGPGELATEVGEHGLPLVIKPVDSRGARGVLRLGDDTDLDWAYAHAASNSPTGRVMIERYLEGRQLSTESIVVGGVAYTPGFADRNYEYLDRFAPFMIENGGDLPTKLDAKMRAAVCETVQRTVDSLKMDSGVIKGDIVVHDGAPHVIEMALRLSGGYLCSHEIPLSTGVDFLGQAIRVVLGEKPAPSELEATFHRGVSQRWLFPDPGRVTAISGVAEVAARPEIAFCEIRVHEGSLISEVQDHPGRAGVVITVADSREEATRSAESAVASIRIETEATVSGGSAEAS